MENKPWKNESWFTSPWNFAPEVREGLNFPDEIKIHDITLRDGEQQTGITFRREEKVEIAKLLAKAGVHRIEAGMPAVSPQDEAAIKEIVDLDLGCEIFAFSRCMIPDVKKAAECGVSGIVVEIPSSEHIIKDAYGWELDKAVKLSIEATLAAKEAGLYTVFFPIDSSRADIYLVPGFDREDRHRGPHGRPGRGGYLRGAQSPRRALSDEEDPGAADPSPWSPISTTISMWAWPTPSWAWPPVDPWPTPP